MSPAGNAGRLLVIALLLGGVLLPSCGSEGGSAPSPAPATETGDLVFDLPDTGLDFGRVGQGLKTERDVEIRNASERSFEITQAVASCGCLKVEIAGDAAVLAPGQTGTLRVRLDTAGFAGRVVKNVALATSPPTSTLAAFRVHFEVAGGLLVLERSARFGPVPPGATAHATLTLRGDGEGPAWEVNEITWLASKDEAEDAVPVAFDVEEIPLEDGRRLRLTLHHPGGDAVGLHPGRLRLRTTHAEHAALGLPSVLHVVERIGTSRSRVLLGKVWPGRRSLASRVRLEVAAGAVAPERVEAGVERGGKTPAPGAGTSSGFRAAVGRDEAGWWIDVLCDGSVDRHGPLTGTLILETDAMDHSVIRLPVEATVQAGVR